MACGWDLVFFGPGELVPWAVGITGAGAQAPLRLL